MKRTFLVFPLIGLALVAGLLMASRALSGGVQADQRAVSAANTLVESGHTAEAVQIYEQLVAQGARRWRPVLQPGQCLLSTGRPGPGYRELRTGRPADPA